eukprot:CAMPEP_0172331044 /NCGR_PEP_ID=MMETSP1058-20130122/61724_1 /TAXON_ID=83371 /ORGANISM="Detonula confervacea, Strain CCMP 353" /LENGTH=409 /DNA_ID=CAMNT_0013048297 /DNA_START=81 /DNA_END=1308 /DNA_ORIENTATION=+
MVGGMDDDVSVISMDPSIMTTNSGAKSNENEESLGKITEEQDSNDVSGSAQDQEHNSSSGNRRHSQTLSNASANPSTRAGSAPARGEGDRFNRLLERKLAAETSRAKPGELDYLHKRAMNSEDTNVGLNMRYSQKARAVNANMIDVHDDSANDGNPRAVTTVGPPHKNIATPGAQSVKDGVERAMEGVHDMNNRASVDTGRQHSGSNSLGENTSNISRPSNNGGRSRQETARCSTSSGSRESHYKHVNEGSGRPGQGEHSRERNGMGRSHGGNNEGEIQNRGKYFSTLQHQSEAHAEPSDEIYPVGVPIMVGGLRDDVSVISMDPRIMTTNSRSSNRSGAKSNESLGKILEEQDRNDVSGGARDQEHNSSSVNRSHSQNLSNVSANLSTRVGPVPVKGEGDRFNRLLER